MDPPQETRDRYDTSSLRIVACSGSSMSPKLITEFMDEFGDVLYNLYGSTEVSWATIATPADMRRREVVVTGVPDEEFGRRFAAFVVPHEGEKGDPNEVRAHVRDVLGRFSVPRDVVMLDELPRNATGKVVKRLLPRQAPRE